MEQFNTGTLSTAVLTKKLSEIIRQQDSAAMEDEQRKANGARGRTPFYIAPLRLAADGAGAFEDYSPFFGHDLHHNAAVLRLRLGVIAPACLPSS